MKRRIHIFSALCLMLALGGITGAQDGRVLDAEQDIEIQLRYAASQHEIISLLLDEGQYQFVREEFQKILALGLGGVEEKAVTQSAWAIVTRLREAEQFELAHTIVDETLATVEEVTNRFSLYMVKAKIYQDQRLYPEAIQLLREAQKLGVVPEPGQQESQETARRPQ